MPVTIKVREPSAALLELVAKAEADPGSDEAYFLGQLRAAIAGFEGPVTAFAIGPRSPRPERMALRLDG